MMHYGIMMKYFILNWRIYNILDDIMLFWDIFCILEIISNLIYLNLFWILINSIL